MFEKMKIELMEEKEVLKIVLDYLNKHEPTKEDWLNWRYK